jgi:hypothetical protein
MVDHPASAGGPRRCAVGRRQGPARTCEEALVREALLLLLITLLTWCAVCGVQRRSEDLRALEEALVREALLLLLRGLARRPPRTRPSPHPCANAPLREPSIVRTFVDGSSRAVNECLTNVRRMFDECSMKNRCARSGQRRSVCLNSLHSDRVGVRWRGAVRATTHRLPSLASGAHHLSAGWP